MHPRIFIRPVRWTALALGTTAVLVPATLSVSGCGAGKETETDDARLGSAVQAQTTPICVSIQRGVFGAVTDAHIASEQPAKNYGAKTLANVGFVGAGARQSLFRFDLGAVPATATVTSAKLTLTAYQSLPLGSSATLRAHRILSPWTEGTVTWGLFNASFYPAVEASAINDRHSPATTTFDLTALAQAWVSGSYANHGLLLEQPETTTTNISTSEATNASSRPRLEVCYQPFVDTGKSATAMVSGGDVSKSAKYKMVHTLGQSTQNQGQTMSPSYSVAGGLSGANATLP
jgi:hypothetical protein